MNIFWMNILDFVLNWILNLMIFRPDSMKKWIFKKDRPPLPHPRVQTKSAKQNLKASLSEKTKQLLVTGSIKTEKNVPCHEKFQAISCLFLSITVFCSGHSRHNCGCCLCGPWRWLLLSQVTRAPQHGWFGGTKSLPGPPKCPRKGRSPTILPTESPVLLRRWKREKYFLWCLKLFGFLHLLQYCCLVLLISRRPPLLEIESWPSPHKCTTIRWRGPCWLFYNCCCWWWSWKW